MVVAASYEITTHWYIVKLNRFNGIRCKKITTNAVLFAIIFIFKKLQYEIKYFWKACNFFTPAVTYSLYEVRTILLINFKIMYNEQQIPTHS
jgi:hypothetical protein